MVKTLNWPLEWQQFQKMNMFFFAISLAFWFLFEKWVSVSQTFRQNFRNIFHRLQRSEHFALQFIGWNVKFLEGWTKFSTTSHAHWFLFRILDFRFLCFLTNVSRIEIPDMKHRCQETLTVLDPMNPSSMNGSYQNERRILSIVTLIFS